MNAMTETLVMDALQGAVEESKPALTSGVSVDDNEVSIADLVKNPDPEVIADIESKLASLATRPADSVKRWCVLARLKTWDLRTAERLKLLPGCRPYVQAAKA